MNPQTIIGLDLGRDVGLIFRLSASRKENRTMKSFRFPHTAHLAWLGPSRPREDKVFSQNEREAFLAGEVVVEEKIDGANLGFFLEDGVLYAVNRGSIIDLQNPPKQFKFLPQWLAPREEAFKEALSERLVLYGEWCYARHTILYTRLPDWFVVFDVYDRSTRKFYSTQRRNNLAKGLGLSVVPHLYTGKITFEGLLGLLGQSRFGDGPAEGVYLRREDREWLIARCKLVRAEFVQAIVEHWSSRPIEVNRVVGPFEY